MLAFDHDHVDVDGADDWLGQTFAFLQQVGNVFGTDILVRTLSVREEFPNRNTLIRQISLNNLNHRFLTIHFLNNNLVSGCNSKLDLIKRSRRTETPDVAFVREDSVLNTFQC